MNELKRVMLVEDDDDVAEIATIALETFAGFDVLRCARGHEALEAFESFAPQFVLLDVMMPGMDGPETLAHLRELRGGADTPVAFMTAKVQVHEQKAYLELGALAVIPKPFDPVSLGEKIKGLWKSSIAGPSV